MTKTLVASRFTHFLNFVGPVGFISMVLGVNLLLAYLNSVRLAYSPPFYSMLLGASLCSVSLVFSFVAIRYSKSERFPLASLYILTLGLLLVSSMRYDLFHGADVLGEFKIASITATTKRWPIDLQYYGTLDRPGRYASCISVTILPSVLSQITGLNTLHIFKYIFPSIGAFLSILLYLLLKKTFDNRELAFLAATLFATSHHFVFVLSYLFREQFGLFFLLLSLLSLLVFRSYNFVIPLVLLAGVVLSDYATTVLTFLILASMSFAYLVSRIKKLGHADREKEDPNEKRWILTFFYFTTVMLGWFFFVATPIFSDIAFRLEYGISIAGRYGFDFMLKLITFQWRPPFVGPIASSSEAFGGGLIVSIWYYLLAVLIVLGLIYSARKQMTDLYKRGWAISCLFMFLVFTFSYSYYFPIEPNRTYLIGGIFFSYLIALPLWALIGTRPKNIKLRKALKYTTGLIFIFLFLNLPINLSLPTHQTILHYHSEVSIPPELRVLYYDTGTSDLVFSQWIEDYISSNGRISLDFRGFLDTYLANHMNRTFVFDANFAYGTVFLTVSHYYLKYGIWGTKWGVSNVTHLSSQKLFEYSMVYNDGKTMLLYKPQK